MEGILLLVAVSVAIGFFLIFLAALTEKKRAKLHPPPERTFTIQQFEKICFELADRFKLEAEEIQRSPENQQIDIFAKNKTPVTGGDFLIRGLLLGGNETVGAAQILEFSNVVVQERASKGIFITTGRFTDELLTIGELAPMEFIDGVRLKDLIR